MADTSQWHYTNKTGQQAGPVSTDNLLKLIDSKDVPMSAMAWKDGMPTWKPISQIPELLSTPVAHAASSPPPITATQSEPMASPATNPASAPAPSAAIDPYTTPQAGPSLSYDEIHGNTASFGGIGRLAYFLVSFAFGIISNIAQFAFVGEQSDPSILIGIALLSVIISFALVFARFKNIGMSRWWTLGLFVPILNIFVSIWLISRQEGWIETRRLDTAGKIIAWIFGILISAIVVLALISVLFFAGTAYKEAADKTEQKIKAQQEQTQPRSY